MKMRKIVDTKNMSRLDWLKHRRNGIGGSDASKIVGISKYGSPLSVWLEKTSLEDPIETESEAAYWGTVLEETVAKEFERRTGMKVRKKNALICHDDYDWMTANIDREIVGQRVGLECKTSSAYRDKEWEGEEIPAEYLIQCQHYMAVTGYQVWYIAVLIGGNKFVYKRIERDEELIDMLIQQEKNFWENYIVPRVMPPVDGSEASSEVLSALFPFSNAEHELVLDSEQEKLLKERASLKDQVDRTEARIKEIDNTLKMAMGDAEKASGMWFNISFKSSVRNSLDTKRLKAEMPDVYEKYTKESVTRTFKVTELEEKEMA